MIERIDVKVKDANGITRWLSVLMPQKIGAQYDNAYKACVLQIGGEEITIVEGSEYDITVYPIPGERIRLNCMTCPTAYGIYASMYDIVEEAHSTIPPLKVLTPTPEETAVSVARDELL